MMKIITSVALATFKPITKIGKVTWLHGSTLLIDDGHYHQVFGEPIARAHADLINTIERAREHFPVWVKTTCIKIENTPLTCALGIPNEDNHPYIYISLMTPRYWLQRERLFLIVEWQSLDDHFPDVADIVTATMTHLMHPLKDAHKSKILQLLAMATNAEVDLMNGLTKALDRVDEPI